jgi:hypothetical protein
MSATQITTTTATRVNLGPLTTAFSPPRDCRTLHFIDDDVAMLNVDSDHLCPQDWKVDGSYTCTTGDCSGHVVVVVAGSTSLIESCYPRGLGSYYSVMLEQDGGVWSFQPGIYSPGLICPSGYFPECTVVRSEGVPNPEAANPGAVADNAIWDMLHDGETAIGCCPL